MDWIIRSLIAASALAFLLAVAGSLRLGEIAGVPPEAYSRACTNLALIAIAAAVAAGRPLASRDGAG